MPYTSRPDIICIKSEGIDILSAIDPFFTGMDYMAIPGAIWVLLLSFILIPFTLLLHERKKQYLRDCEYYKVIN